MLCGSSENWLETNWEILRFSFGVDGITLSYLWWKCLSTNPYNASCCRSFMAASFSSQGNVFTFLYVVTFIELCMLLYSKWLIFICSKWLSLTSSSLFNDTSGYCYQQYYIVHMFWQPSHQLNHFTLISSFTTGYIMSNLLYFSSILLEKHSHDRFCPKFLLTALCSHEKDLRNATKCILALLACPRLSE